MSVKSVRAAIDQALEGSCNRPHVTPAEARKITKAALADRYNFPEEREAIKDFFETRRPAAPRGGVQTRACPESSNPTFDPAAVRAIERYLNLPANGKARGAQ